MNALTSAVGKVVSGVKNMPPNVKQAIITELRPPTPVEFAKGLRDGFRMFSKPTWRETTVRDAWRNTLVTTEVICWFFVGEVIGKGTLIGYQV